MILIIMNDNDNNDNNNDNNNDKLQLHTEQNSTFKIETICQMYVRFLLPYPFAS